MKNSTALKNNGIYRNIKRGIDFIGYCIKKSPVICLGDMILYAMTIGVFPVLTANLWGKIVDKIIAGEKTILFLVLLGIVGGLSNAYLFWGEIVDNVFRCKVSLLMQERIHKKAEAISTDDYEKSYIRDLSDRASQVFYFGPAIGFFFSGELVFASIMSCILTMILMASYHPFFVFIIMCLTGVDLGGVFIEKRRAKIAVEQTEARRIAENYRNYLWRYENVKETKSHLAEEFFSKRWKHQMFNILDTENRKYKRLELLHLLLKTIGIMMLMSGYVIGIVSLIKGRLSIGEFSTVMILLRQSEKYTETFTQAVSSMSGELSHIQTGYEFLELSAEKESGIQLPSNIQELNAEDVSYHYPDSEEMVLEDISLNLKKGKIYAIVGENGAGKTTLAKVLLGLISPVKGRVTVNGVDLSTISYSERYRDSSAVFQDYCSYPMTTSENITFEAVPDNCRLQQMLPPFVEADEILGKEVGGTELSGGEWQQIAIARGKYKKADIIVLDEPNSALDAFTEKEVYRSFSDLAKEKIGLIITHRMGITKFSDEIIVIKDGKIVMKGSHDMLMECCSYYREIWGAGQSMYGIN